MKTYNVEVTFTVQVEAEDELQAWIMVRNMTPEEVSEADRLGGYVEEPVEVKK